MHACHTNIEDSLFCHLAWMVASDMNDFNVITWVTCHEEHAASQIRSMWSRIRSWDHWLSQLHLWFRHGSEAPGSFNGCSCGARATSCGARAASCGARATSCSCGNEAWLSECASRCVAVSLSRKSEAKEAEDDLASAQALQGPWSTEEERVDQIGYPGLEAWSFDIVQSISTSKSISFNIPPILSISFNHDASGIALIGRYDDNESKTWTIASLHHHHHRLWFSLTLHLSPRAGAWRVSRRLPEQRLEHRSRLVVVTWLHLGVVTWSRHLVPFSQLRVEGSLQYPSEKMQIRIFDLKPHGIFKTWATKRTFPLNDDNTLISSIHWT